MLVGARNKAERKETEKFLANFVRVNINEAITDNAVDKKATQVARSLDATATAEAKAEIAAKLSEYSNIYWKDLVSYTDNFTGDKVRVRGRVFNIVESGEAFQMWIVGTYEAVYVETEKAFSGLYENDVITVYGTVNSYKCFKNANDADICQPLLSNAFYTK